MTKLLLLVIIASLFSCSSPATAPEASSTPIFNPEKLDQKADRITSQTSCGGSQWSGDEVDFYSCELDGGRWKCLCDGVSFFSNVVECRDALQTTCDVSEDVFGGCQSQFGVCNPDGDDIRCQCFESDETFLTDRDSCTIDLFAMCSSSCTVGENTCVPNPTIPDHYRCECGAEASKSQNAQSCEAALDNACNRVACSGWAGYCQEITSPEWSYDCQCVNGDSGMKTITELGGAFCDDALTSVCGEAQEQGCSEETQQGTWSCEPVAGTIDNFDCTCHVQCENDERIITDSFRGSSCEMVLGSFCDYDELCSR